ncbi:LacI family DNA-binding transcriptional regulator [Okibacterium endophyticum]
MREVAARAGVSAKTVSRVFNDDPHVLPETRALVERVMRELNYVPNVLATTFRSGRAWVIGVAVPDIVDPFFAAIARAVEKIAREQGMSTIVTSVGDDPDNERPALESLLSRQLSGLVVAPVGRDHSWLERWQEHTPIVCVDRAPIGLRADTFTEDDATGGYLATQHLIEHGHRRIAYLGDAIHLSTETKRLGGWRRALSEAGLSDDDDLVAVHASDLTTTRFAVERFRSLDDPPTAVFSANARCTMALVHVLRDDPLPLVSFGDFPMADVLTPSITVIDQDPTRIGTLAAERVLARLTEPTAELERVNVIDVALVERDSCRIGS